MMSCVLYGFLFITAVMKATTFFCSSRSTTAVQSEGVMVLSSTHLAITVVNVRPRFCHERVAPLRDGKIRQTATAERTSRVGRKGTWYITRRKRPKGHRQQQQDWLGELYEPASKADGGFPTMHAVPFVWFKAEKGRVNLFVSNVVLCTRDQI